MCGLRKQAVLAAMAITILNSLPVRAQDAAMPVPHGPVQWLPDHDWSGQWCRYPGSNPKRTAKTIQSTIRPTVIQEVEPNDVAANAQVLSISPTPTNPVDVDVHGTIDVGADVDLYQFSANKGDIYGIAVLSQGSLDPVLAIQQSNEVSLIENDNWNGLSTMYPANSPFPGGVGLYDSALTWICPVNGIYLIRVTSYASASRGDYIMQIRARRPSCESLDVGSSQIVFLDFDGATINAQDTFFGLGNSAATLSPLRDFLPRWGLTTQDEAQVVQSIIDATQQTIDYLRTATLNGDLKTDNVLGHMDIQLLNSRDNADPWGQPNVSRVIIGGTIDQLGILTIGISEAIDPGDFDHEKTAVVLLDLLSDVKDDPNSINSIGLASGVTIYDAIGQTVAHIAVHEMGHLLGNWHTDPLEDIPSIMDTGGDAAIGHIAGAGPDDILGTADDQIIDFAVKDYDPAEAVAVGLEHTDVNTAFALSSGRIQQAQPPVTPPSTLPQASIRATPTSGPPPLTVSFAAGAIDNSNDVTYSWDFADGSSAASGPVVQHQFVTPGQFLVKVTATNSQGDTGQATVLITVSALSPTAMVVATPTRGPAPLTVSFDGSGSTTASPDITLVRYDWDFGDNTTGSGVTVQHVYQTAGYYAAKLTVTDSNGATSTASALITVNAAASSTSLDAAQQTPTATLPAASPQCGLGSGLATISSCAGLFVLMMVRRRY